MDENTLALLSVPLHRNTIARLAREDLERWRAEIEPLVLSEPYVVQEMPEAKWPPYAGAV